MHKPRGRKPCGFFRLAATWPVATHCHPDEGLHEHPDQH
jgi:hypothetical protein